MSNNCKLPQTKLLKTVKVYNAIVVVVVMVVVVVVVVVVLCLLYK